MTINYLKHGLVLATASVLVGLSVAGEARAANCTAGLAHDCSVWGSQIFDQPKMEHVMDLVVTCSDPVVPGPSNYSSDGMRDAYWPIVGGRADGPNFHAAVVPGGADLPLIRPDGIYTVNALYRLLTDDGQTIVIHDPGMEYPTKDPNDFKMRVTPSFIAPQGKYEWLNKNVFVGNLIIPAPKNYTLAKNEHENDRLIQIFRIY